MLILKIIILSLSFILGISSLETLSKGNKLLILFSKTLIVLTAIIIPYILFKGVLTW